MSRTKQAGTQNKIPYLRNLDELFKHVKARPPLHKEFDIRQIDPAVIRAYDHVAQPFRHSFYCIALFLEGEVTLNTGFWKTKLNKPALYFKTPCQVVSWVKPETWIKEYFIVFTEGFLLRHKALSDIVFNLPFFELEKAIPFEIDNDDVELLRSIYQQILLEYQSDNRDKLELIATYTHALLIHVRRLYYKIAEADEQLTKYVSQSEQSLLERFRALVQKQIIAGEGGKQSRSVKFFASQLATHPNHLNAVVKRRTDKTAIAFIHEQIANEAMSPAEPDEPKHQRIGIQAWV